MTRVEGRAVRGRARLPPGTRPCVVGQSERHRDGVTRRVFVTRARRFVRRVLGPPKRDDTGPGDALALGAELFVTHAAPARGDGAARRKDRHLAIVAATRHDPRDDKNPPGDGAHTPDIPSAWPNLPAISISELRCRRSVSATP